MQRKKTIRKWGSLLTAASLLVLQPVTALADMMYQPLGIKYGDKVIMKGDFTSSNLPQDYRISARAEFANFKVDPSTKLPSNAQSPASTSFQDTKWELLPEDSWSQEQKQALAKVNGYMLRYLGNSDNIDPVTGSFAQEIYDNARAMVDTYAKVYGGNFDYMWARVKHDLDSANGNVQNIDPNDKKYFYVATDSTLGKSLFINSSWVANLAGAGSYGSDIVLPPGIPPYTGAPGDDTYYYNYFSQPMGTYQEYTSAWPTIKPGSFQVLPNGDIAYDVSAYGVGGAKVKAELIGNMADTFAGNTAIKDFNDYWKHWYAFFPDEQNEAMNFKSMPVPGSGDYVGKDVGEAKGTISAADVASVLDPSKPINKVTLYVTDGFGRYVYQTIDYVPKKLHNLKVVSLTVNPSSLEQGKTGTATVVVENDSDSTMTSPVVLAVDGNSPMSQTVTLGAGQQQTLTFSFSIPLQNTVHLQATINPNHDNPSDETTYTDNAKDISVPAVVKKPVRPPVSTPGAYDLAAEIPVGQSNLRFVKTTPIDCIVKNGGFYVYDKDGNAIEIPITCNVKITVSYPGYKQEFVRTVTSMKPGKLVHLEVPTPDYKAFGTSYKSPYPENAYLDIQVKEEVNYDDAVDEENHGNNVANGTVRVYWSKTKLQPKK